ncbi:MAG: NEW3 domain-containing protein [Thermoplasmata archaeon]
MVYSQTQAYTEQFASGSISTHNWLWRPIEGGNYTVNITITFASDQDMSNNYFEKIFSVDPAITLNVNEEGLGNITSTDKSVVYVVNGLVNTEKYYILAAYTYSVTTYRRPMVSIYNDAFEIVLSNGTWFAYTPTYNGTYYFKISNRTTEVAAFTFIVATRAGLKDLYANGQGYIIDNCSKTIDPANFYIVSLSSGTTYTITAEETDSVADVVAYFIYESNMTYFAYTDYTSLVITPSEDLFLIIIVVPYGSTYPDGMYNISITPLPGEVPTLSALINTTVATVNPGEVTTFAITLTSTGSSPVEVNIALENLPFAWSYSISESTVSVTPGTPYIVYVNVTPSITALAESYQFNIAITSTIASYMFTPTVTVQPMHSISVNFVQSSISAQAGSTVIFDVDITSASNLDENVILTAYVPSGWSSAISPSNQISIPAFGNVQVQVTITIPSNALASTNVVWLNATYSGNQASANAQVVVSAIYGLELSLENGKTIFPGQTLTYNFTITSTANAPDTVDLTLDLPASWTISALSTPIALPIGSQSYSGSFAVNVPLNAAPGTYTITLHAVSQGNVSIHVTGSVSTVVESLYGVSISASPSQMAEPGTTVTYTINITSNWADTILITTNGLSDWMPALSASQITFESAGTASVYLTLTAPTTVTQGNYDIVVTAVSQNQSSANASVTVSTMVIISPYGVSISQPINQTTSAGASVTYTFSVSSTAADTIIITTSGLSAWLPGLSTTRLTFESAGTQTVTLLLIPPANAEGVYDITVIATSENNTAKFASVTVRTTVIPAPAPRYDVEMTIGTSSYTLSVTNTQVLPVIVTLKNNGTVLDNITVTVSGLPAGWTATQKYIELAAGETGTLTIMVTIPGNAASGDTTLTFVATSLNVSVKDSKPVTITITRPDLSIAYITITPVTPRVGDTVTFTIGVKNSGTGIATNINVTILVDGKAVATKQITSLDVGQETTVTQIYTFTKDGEHTVKAIVDAEGNIVEINDINNELSEPVKVKAKSTPAKTLLGMEEGFAYIVIALIIAVVIVLLAVIFVMRRKKPPVESATINLQEGQTEQPTTEQPAEQIDQQVTQDTNIPQEQEQAQTTESQTEQPVQQPTQQDANQPQDEGQAQQPPQ